MPRKHKLVSGETYHIYSKSIAGFKIFNKTKDYTRAMNMMRYYQVKEIQYPYSTFIKLKGVLEDSFINYFKNEYGEHENIVQIICYCFMPTHIHLILRQLKENGISEYMRKLLDAYTRYFNINHKRKGPLWESRFNNVLVKKDSQLLHLTRYIHLNPVIKKLVEKPEDWLASSYKEYIKKPIKEEKICEYKGILDIRSARYKKFVEDRISYQRELAQIKHLLLEEA